MKIAFGEQISDEAIPNGKEKMKSHHFIVQMKKYNILPNFAPNYLIFSEWIDYKLKYLHFDNQFVAADWLNLYK